MALPSQVERQVAAMEAFDKKVAEDANPTNTNPDPQPPAAPQDNPGTPAPDVAALQGQIQTLTAQLSDENNPTFKSRWLSLQGMYNAQVPALQHEVKTLRGENDALKTEITQLKEPRKAGKELVTKTDVEAFGEDLVDLVRRGAREEIATLTAGYEDKVTKLTSELQAARQETSTVAESQARSQSEAFLSDLNTRLPRWREIQDSPEGQAFLASHIPGTRTEWNTALVTAAERFDLKAVLEVFGQLQAAYPKFAPQPQPTPQPQAGARSELERQVTPSRAQGNPAQPNNGKRLYTGPEYEAESMRLMRLTQQGKHEEATRLDAELNAALAERRVRN